MANPRNRNYDLPKERRVVGRRDNTSAADRLFEKPEPKTGNDALRARAEAKAPINGPKASNPGRAIGVAEMGAGRAASAARIAGGVSRVLGAAGAVTLAGQAGYAVGSKVYEANQSSIQDYLDDVRSGGKKMNYSGKYSK